MLENISLFQNFFKKPVVVLIAFYNKEGVGKIPTLEFLCIC